MQGDDLNNIRAASARAREALRGVNLVAGMKPATTPNVQSATPAVTQRTPLAKAQAPQATQEEVLINAEQVASLQLRPLTETERNDVETYLQNGEYDSAMHYLLDCKNASLNDSAVISGFDKAMRVHSTYLFNASIAWRVPISISMRSEDNETYSQNEFRRFLKDEHARRAGTQSKAEKIVTQFENAKIQSPKGEFLKTLIGLISHRHLNSATELLHSHDRNRFQMTVLEQGYIESAIEVAGQKLTAWHHDRGYRNTVASAREEENANFYFNEDLRQFRQTFSQYVSGEPLRQYEAPNPYRNYDWSSNT